MSQWINTYLFGIYPYICLSVFLIGSLIRFDREQYTWRSQSSQLLRRRQLTWGSNLFHAGILIILVGHTGGLLTPVVIFEMLGISHTAKPAPGSAYTPNVVLRRHRRSDHPVGPAPARLEHDFRVPQSS